MEQLETALKNAAQQIGVTPETMRALLNNAQADVPVVGALFAIRDVLEKEGGGFGISCMKKPEADNDVWVGSLEWGKEAEDSPMVGAAAYSQADTFNDCIVELAKDAGLMKRD
jgi:hypothetical protein